MIRMTGNPAAVVARLVRLQQRGAAWCRGEAFACRPARDAKRPARECFAPTLAFVVLVLTLAAQAPAQQDADRRLPTLFIIGDSTVHNTAKGQRGWGDVIARWFDPAKIRVEDRARGGRSSRSYRAEGLWDQVVAELRPGDFVLMQFGHNDGGSLTQGRARASLHGSGEETQEVVSAATGKPEVVHTYGWYVRRYCEEARARGAAPIVLSPIPRNIWKEGPNGPTVARASGDYGKWAAEAARAAGASFVDLNDLVARRYEAEGRQKVAETYFGPTDHTHTTPAGAELNAACVVEGIRGLKGCALAGDLAGGPPGPPMLGGDGPPGPPMLGGESAAPPVTLAEEAGSFTLANGSVTARVDKTTGTFSLDYDGLRVINRGYWSQVGRSSAGDIGRFGSVRSTTVRTDPAKNGGARAEIECRFGYDGRSPGLPCDVTMRFALGRGDHGLYTYAVWEHKPGYPAFSVGEARTAYKLNPDVFDFLVVDAKRRVPMPSGKDWDQGETLNMKEVRRIRTGPLAGRIEHKYDYSAILPDTPAYGWCGTKQRVGVWLINPSFEYVAGGPTKVELTGHNDVNPGGAPTLLNMWHGSHYGGSSLVVGEQEDWTKVIGPFLLYCNSGGDPDALWRDALAKAAAEQRAWPYAWVSDPNYPLAAARGTVTGSITVSDPLAPRQDAHDVRDLRVGLASPRYTPEGARRDSAAAAPVDWQRDSKHYQSWTRADGAGRFRIPNVRPGAYTLYAFADGVLGEYSRADVGVEAGRTLDLGRLAWKPVHYGRPVWQIGTADRSAAEFRHGDDYWRWGLYYLYPKEFPHDVDFVVGHSDPKRDWNYCQPPRIEGDRVESTTWTIEFDLPNAPPKSERATLRLAICGSRGQRGIAVSVNDTLAGDTGPLPDTGVMHRDGIRGYWYERDVAFDAALLRKGRNTIKLRVPATNWTQGVLYDCVRLEVGPAR